MINIKNIKNSLENCVITNLIFDPSILFISEKFLTDDEQCDVFIENLINLMNIINEYNLNLYWSHELQQIFYQKFYHIIVNYRPQILASFYQKLFPKLILIRTEGYNQCNIIPNIVFCNELSDCYLSFQILVHFLIHNKSYIGYFLSIFQTREDYVFSCIDCEECLAIKPFLIKEEKDVYNFLLNYCLIEEFPLKDDETIVKDQKIKTIINLELFVKNNFNEIKRDYEFSEEFWNSEFLYTEDYAFRRKIIEVVCTILLNPDTNLFRKHKLENQYIEINGTKNSIKQYDIFQEYRLCGVDITPRLLVSFFQDKIFFYKIINRH